MLLPIWLRWFSRTPEPVTAPVLAPVPPSLPVVAVESQAPGKPMDVGPVYEFARRLVAWAETQQASGEWRRHQVYARLVKAFPHRPKDLLSLVVELAAREQKYGVDLRGMAQAILAKK